MLFSIEALDAGEGDCLLLSWGSRSAPNLLVLDGGPAGAYRQVLRPRLRQLRGAFGVTAGQPLPLELVVLTHNSADHAGGLLELLDDVRDCRLTGQPFPVNIREMWHDSFDDVVGDRGLRAALKRLQRPLVSVASPEWMADADDGQTVRDRAEELDCSLNACFEPARGDARLVARPDDAALAISWDTGLTLTVLGPTQSQLADCRRRWRRIVAPDTAPVRPRDLDVPDIILLAEFGDLRALLPGDAHSEDILAGLDAAQKLPADGSPLHVDVFKLPQSGDRSGATAELFRRVVADTYILSGNGLHGTPDCALLATLARARGDQPFTIGCTFERDAYRQIAPTCKRTAEQRAAMERAQTCLAHLPGGRNEVMYRRHDQLGIKVVLGDQTLPSWSLSSARRPAPDRSSRAGNADLSTSGVFRLL
jgi:hypothetical protein